MNDWPDIIDDALEGEPAFTPPADEDRLNRRRIDVAIADRRAANRRHAWRVTAVVLAATAIIYVIVTSSLTGDLASYVAMVVAVVLWLLNRER